LTDRLSLTNALADANIERQKAERIATEIFDAIHENVATKADVAALQADLQRVEAALKAELKAEITAARAEVSVLKQRMLVHLAELEHRLTVRFGGVMVVVTGIVLAAIRYLPHG
jgi:Asp/Glu/hydantoin racemase